MIKTIKIEKEDDEHVQSSQGDAIPDALSLSLLSCKPEPDECFPVSTPCNEGVQTTKQCRMKKVSVLLVDCCHFIAGKSSFLPAVKPELPLETNAPDFVLCKTEPAFKESGIGGSNSRRLAASIPMRGLSVVLVDCCKRGVPHGNTGRQAKHLSRGSRKSQRLTTSKIQKATVNRKNLHYCSGCSKSFHSLKQLKGHQCTDAGQSALSCTKCGKHFTTPGNLVRHQLTHTKTRPHRCSSCSKIFSRRDHLVLHQRTHTGEKPYVCSKCKKAFSDSTHFRNHQQVHTKRKSYHCSECDRSFRDQSNFNRHQRIHSGVKPYQCSECGKRFNRTEHLKVHKRTHTGERPYECQLCGKGFRRKAHLRHHLHTHRGKAGENK